jgi:hypothetical protein
MFFPESKSLNYPIFKLAYLRGYINILSSYKKRNVVNSRLIFFSSTAFLIAPVQRTFAFFLLIKHNTESQFFVIYHSTSTITY